MTDAERRLFRCIGGIDDELILEAATARFQPKRWGHWAALAACLVLVLTIPAFLNRNDGGPDYEYAAAPESGNTAQGTEGPELEGGSYDLSLGGVQLGMTEEEVIAVLGEPMDQENGWINYNGISIGISQFLPQVISIHLRNGPLTLPSGIGIGSTKEAVTDAYPDAHYMDYPAPGGIEDPDGLYVISTDHATLELDMKDGTVCKIRLFNPTDPMLDALSVNEITIYQWIDQQWQTTTVIDKAAKGICTVLTISEPEEATGEKTGVSGWMDFGNGTAVELLGENRAAVWTYDGAFDPDKTDGMTWHLTGVFTDYLDEYVAQALADPTATWDKKSLELFEGGPEGAPEAEP